MKIFKPFFFRFILLVYILNLLWKLSECRKNVYIWQEIKDMRYFLLMDDLTK